MLQRFLCERRGCYFERYKEPLSLKTATISSLDPACTLLANSGTHHGPPARRSAFAALRITVSAAPIAPTRSFTIHHAQGQIASICWRDDDRNHSARTNSPQRLGLGTVSLPRVKPRPAEAMGPADCQSPACELKGIWQENAGCCRLEHQSVRNARKIE